FLESKNLGKSWQVLEYTAYKFHQDPAFPDRVFATSQNKLKILTPTGWKLQANLPSRTTVQEIISVPRNREKLFANLYPYSGINKVLRSTNEGQTWGPINLGLKGTIQEFASLDLPNEGLLASGREIGIFHRTGANWVPSILNFGDSYVTQITA